MSDASKKRLLSGTDILIDAFAQVKIELWKYDPDILSKKIQLTHFPLLCL